MKNYVSAFLLLCIVALPAFGYPRKKHHSPATQTAMTAIPAGIPIRARIIDNLNSGTAQVGDTLHATLEDQIAGNGRTLFPRNSDVIGSVLDVHRSGRLSDPGTLKLGLTSVTNGSQTMPLSVEPFEIKGESHTTSNVEKIGGGAAVGAIIGGIAGGGKGAAIVARAPAPSRPRVSAPLRQREAQVGSATLF